MSNAKVRHRRRRRHKLASEWWVVVVHGRLVLMPPWLRHLRRNPFVAKALALADREVTATLFPKAP